MNKYPEGRCRSTGREQGRYIVAAGSIFLLLAVVVALYVHFKPAPPPPVDPPTLCPERPVAITAVLVDSSDPFSSVQQADICARLEGIKANIVKYGRLDIYTVPQGQGELARLEFSMCSPGKGKDEIPLGASERLAVTKWKRKFADKVDEVMPRVVADRRANQTRLFEAINAVCVQSFQSSAQTNGVSFTLVIVSDMMHRTSDWSHYRGRRSFDFDAFRATNYYASTRTSILKHANVRVIYVRRQELGRSQGEEHKEFWRAYFRSCGATVEFEEVAD